MTYLDKTIYSFLYSFLFISDFDRVHRKVGGIPDIGSEQQINFWIKKCH